MAIQPQQPRQQRRGDSGGGTACTRRSAPLIYSILFCPSLFFPFIPTHTHTHIDTLYIEAKTKNKAGVFFLFSPSLFCFLFPPYLHIFSYPPLPHNFLSFPTSHFFHLLVSSCHILSFQHPPFISSP